MGIFDSLFNKKDPKEVFDLTVKGLILIRDCWIDFFYENGVTELIKPFLSDPTTLGYLLGFVEYIYTEYGVKEEEASGVIYKVFSSFWKNIEEYVDDVRTTMIDKKEEITNSLPIGQIVGEFYIKYITDKWYYIDIDGKKHKNPDQYFSLISEAPQEYFKKIQ